MLREGFIMVYHNSVTMADLVTFLGRTGMSLFAHNLSKAASVTDNTESMHVG
jgi:hypothetical protein